MALLHLNQEGFETLLEKEPIVLVDFWAEWCGPCRMLGPTIEELANDLEGKVAVGKINVDEEGDLAAKFGVMSIPTVIAFKDGKETDRIVGLRSKQDYLDLLD